MTGAPADEPLISVDGLEVATRGHHGARVLDGVSFEVAAGETLCVVGESGSGKTVTALAIMGLLPPRELIVAGGSIRLVGEELIGAGPDRLRRLRARRMAMIFQEPMTALNPLMPVGRQIDEVLRAHTGARRRDRRRRIFDLLEAVRLAEADRVAGSYPHQLSGGQRQRVMIAMALALGPRLVIADEPTSALDVVTQQEILRLIAELCARDGTGLVFITHDMGVVAEIADRVAVMHSGRVVETGSRDQVLAAPASPPARDLLHAVPSLVPRAPRAALPGAIALATEGLSKTYRLGAWPRRAHEVKALADVTLSLGRGRTLGIVGESGSGKTTLARCLLRLDVPTRGSIRLGGVEIQALPERDLKPHRRNLQAVFQDPFRSLDPRLPVARSIVEGPLNYGATRERALAEARRLLDLVGIADDALARYPHEFSGGQRQRIALARALALQPQVLVADEPVSALDMPSQARVLDLLADIQARMGMAILFVTHDLRVAAQMCDEIAIIRAGRIVELGPAADILTGPQHPYTRQLLDAVPGRRIAFAGAGGDRHDARLGALAAPGSGQ